MELDAIDATDSAAAGVYTAAAAARHFNWLAQMAATAGVSVDVFAVGCAAANVAQLAIVAQKSGGLLSLQEGERLSV